ncbi:aspartate carbamoyltransferase [Candidatus Bathyarchaeota archaeon]|nr:aspartate carbamoyltransferase [Candidatus Bathyarchaeota archaeon]
MNLEGRDIISIRDFTRSELDYMLAVADQMEPLARKGSNMLSGKIMATLFFEPSTRTKLSFESAMYRLGGSSVGFADPGSSSVQKGENLSDTVRVVENYADVLVVRHPLEGASRLAGEVAEVPVINAGSGAEEHPTQAILDIYTMRREFGSIDGLKVALVGDLRYGRTVHSLAYALSLYRNIKLFLVSPELLRMRSEVLEDISRGVDFEEESDLRKILGEVDVIYMTRIQKERFADPAEYEAVKGSYRLTQDELKGAKREAIVMHPLPRVDEIDPSVDATQHAKYFKQVWYGLLVRMAILGLVIGSIR